MLTSKNMGQYPRRGREQTVNLRSLAPLVRLQPVPPFYILYRLSVEITRYNAGRLKELARYIFRHFWLEIFT